jgi:hypothetical protein
MQREQDQATTLVPAVKRDWASYGQGSGDETPYGRGKQLCAVSLSPCPSHEIVPGLSFPTSPTPPPFDSWASEFGFEALDPDADISLVFEDQASFQRQEDLSGDQLHPSGASGSDQPMYRYETSTVSPHSGSCDSATPARNWLTASSGWRFPCLLLKRGTKYRKIAPATTGPSQATTPTPKDTNTSGNYDICLGMASNLLN